MQPLAQDDLVHRDVVQQPVMADVVEAASDVAFENPLRAVAFGESAEAVFF